jgi:hypothetical protein
VRKIRELVNYTKSETEERESGRYDAETTAMSCNCRDSNTQRQRVASAQAAEMSVCRVACMDGMELGRMRRRIEPAFPACTCLSLPTLVPRAIHSASQRIRTAGAGICFCCCRREGPFQRHSSHHPHRQNASTVFFTMSRFLQQHFNPISPISLLSQCH